MANTFELEALEQAQLERDYAEWCRRFDPKYIVEREEEEEEV
jgi:hypothetical protein